MNVASPEQLAEPVDVTGLHAGFALIVNLIRRCLAICLRFPQAIRHERNPVVYAEKRFPVYPVHQFKLKHVQVVLFAGGQQSFICNVFEQGGGPQMFLNPGNIFRKPFMALL